MDNFPITGRVLDKKIQKKERVLIEKVILENTGEKRDIVKLLNALGKRGYVFHGSRELFETLIPQSGSGKLGIELIYATADPDVAIFYSTTPRNVERDVRRVPGSEKEYFISGANRKLSDGYVYILKGGDFKRIQGLSCIAFRKVKPAAIIKTKGSDFKHKIGKIKNHKHSWGTVWEIIISNYTKGGNNHGGDHIMRVVRNAEMLAKINCPGAIFNAIIAASLHDIGRIGKKEKNKTHALRGAEIAGKMLKKYFSDCDIDSEKIIYAIRHHSEGKVSNDPLIGTIWDADRLDLERVGIKINPAFLSTKAAKDFLGSYQKDINMKKGKNYNNVIKKYKPSKKNEHLHIPMGFTCNNRCVFCMESSHDYGYVKKEKESLEKIFAILRRNKGMRKVAFSRGEPTLNDDLVKCVAYAKEQGYGKIEIISNGRRYADKEYCARLVDAGANLFIISFHGHDAATHEALTRVKGSFTQTMRGLTNLSLLKYKSPFQLCINHVITKKNYKKIPQFFSLLKDFPVNMVSFSVVSPRGDNMESDFADLMPRYSDVAKTLEGIMQKAGQKKLTIGRDGSVVIVDIPLCVSPKLNPMIDFGDIVVFDSGVKKTSFTTEGYKTKRKECKSCSLEKACKGVYKNYADYYGWDEFEPVK
jgi:MoaA/NifB/PqqE/SkfB family radical SAM enzyme